MAKGQIAKDRVANKIAEAFGSDFIGIYDKKYYVWSQEEGEKIQVAISLTCPKNQVLLTPTEKDHDWSGESAQEPVAQTAVDHFEPAEITEEEKQNIIDMMARLGLN